MSSLTLLGLVPQSQITALVKAGVAPRLENLWLTRNQIGDEGCKALAAALGKEGAVPRLKNLYLRDNQIGDSRFPSTHPPHPLTDGELCTFFQCM